MNCLSIQKKKKTDNYFRISLNFSHFKEKKKQNKLNEKKKSNKIKWKQKISKAKIITKKARYKKKCLSIKSQ